MEPGKPQFVRVYAHTPLDGLWTYFRHFETVDDVCAKFIGPGGEDNALAARDCIRQAREYFFSARSAPLLTKPVLLYYGMVSLGKVLFLLDREQRFDMRKLEEFERTGHGLKQTDASDDGDVYRIEDGHVKVVAENEKGGALKPKGIFPQLAAIVNPVGAYAWLGRRFQIKDILRAIPQLDSTLSSIWGEGCGYNGFSARLVTEKDGTIEIEFDASKTGLRDAAEARDRLSYLDPERLEFKPAGDGRIYKFRMRTSGSEAYQIVTREEFFEYAYAAPPALEGCRLDSVLAQYMLMYVLSIVARYKPHRWVQILEGRKSPLLPAIEMSMMTAERWWPNLILNRLTNNWINFSQPSYW